MPIARLRGLNSKSKYKDTNNLDILRSITKGIASTDVGIPGGSIIRMVCNMKMLVNPCCCFLQWLIWQITWKHLIPACFFLCHANQCQGAYCLWRFISAAAGWIGFLEICCHLPLFIVSSSRRGHKDSFLWLFNLRACIKVSGVEPWAVYRRTHWLWHCLAVKKGRCIWTAAL